MILVLPFLNNPNDLDLSYKTDLDFWDCFGQIKIHLITEKIRKLSWIKIKGHSVIIVNYYSTILISIDTVNLFHTSDL